MKIKVCGLTEAANIEAVRNSGADMLGFIFHAASPRDVSQNEELATWLNDQQEGLTGTHRIGVFVNAEVDYILNTVHDYALTHVQLHGNESAGYCRELQLLWSVSTLHKARITKAFQVGDDFDFTSTNEYTGVCDWFVFDTKSTSGSAGGSGERWNWDRLAEYEGVTPFLLSGGIGPDDAGRIRRLDHPQLWGVDLNSRFETEPGVKDEEQIARFSKELRSA